jgi:hypothetical protein
MSTLVQISCQNHIRVSSRYKIRDAFHATNIGLKAVLALVG